MICRRQGRHSQRETIRYICDFSRCRLNVRLCARIHPLLRGHKYSVLSLFGSCLWLLEQNQNSCWRIWGLFRRLYWGENGKWTIKDLNSATAIVTPAAERMENGLLKINVIYCYNVKARI